MPHSAESPIIQFGVFEVDAAAGELRRNGRRVALTGQPMRVLTLLLSRAGAVVTREQLQREIWGADTHVDFEAGLATCINQIRAALGDRAASPRFVETLPRRGYRFIAPIGREVVAEPASGIEAPRRLPRWRSTSVIAALSLALLIAILIAPIPSRINPAPISIVVIPVTVDATRADLGPVSLSLSDALIGSLAAQSGPRARVASPLAVTHLRGRDVTLQDLTALGAEYFVHVTLRSVGGPVLVHAKLAHVSGWILWASDQEMSLEELERQQLPIASELARRVAMEILPSVTGRRAPKAEAVGDYAQAMHDLDNGQVADSLAGFERARTVDPEHAGTIAGLALGTIEAAWLGALPKDSSYEAAAYQARHALTIDPDNARALAAAGAVAWLKDSNIVEAEADLRRALQLQPTLQWAATWQARVRRRSRAPSN